VDTSSHHSFPPTTQRILFPTTDKVSVKAIQLTCENQLLPSIAHKEQSAVMTQAGSVYSPLGAHPMKNTICLFDVDNTLGPARRVCAFPTHARHSTESIRNILPLLQFTESAMKVSPSPQKDSHTPCPLPLSPKKSQKSQLIPPPRLSRYKCTPSSPVFATNALSATSVVPTSPNSRNSSALPPSP